MMRIRMSGVRLGACVLVGAGGTLLGGCASVGGPAPALEQQRLAAQVEVRRTTYGVPQILAENLGAAAFALAYVQLQDYGNRVIMGMESARGRAALVEGPARVAADARNRQRHAVAAENFHLLHRDTRDMYAGFAAGMNYFIRLHADELPAWVQPDYTAIDVLARDVSGPSDAAMSAFRRRVLADPADPLVLVEEDGRWRRALVSGEPGTRPVAMLDEGRGGAAPDGPPEDDQNVGSNAWALGPTRTASGHAILLRNPHLDWSAGYYEAHVRVPGKLDFYGDFRVGGPFSVIGGFNSTLGFSTTNNQSRSHEFYAFRTDAHRPDHIVVGGESLPLRRETVTVEYLEGAVAGSETREFWTSAFGHVVQRADSLVYVYRPANDGDFRAGEQWLEMMKAGTLDEWLEAMRIGARTTSHFTYADAAGNILYVSVSTPPALPHPAGGDTLAILATRMDQVWSRTVPFDSLPRLLNPPGGYLHNENDSPHYTNLNQVLDHDFSFWVEEPRLRLRSQHALELLHNDRIMTLEDVIEAKHSMRMLLADRVKDDLIAVVRATATEDEVVAAIDFLAAWDDTAAAESRGGVLFEIWWDRYRSMLAGREPHAVAWTPRAPTTTPHGLADPVVAAEAFAWAVPVTASRFGSWDVAWGDVHRVRRGEVDAPVGGCGGALGCFRVLNFSVGDEGKRVADGGDGWVLAVEFGEEPRAYSVLAYGQSPFPHSPYHANQAALFAANQMKPVLWSEADIEANTAERYRPGEERSTP